MPLEHLRCLSCSRSALMADMDHEITALRVLCLGTPQGSVKEIARSLLAAYCWHNALHQAVWEALTSLTSENPELLRQLLPAKLTCLGFPDVEWGEFFAPHPLSKDKAIALLRCMAGSALP